MFKAWIFVLRVEPIAGIFFVVLAERENPEVGSIDEAAWVSCVVYALGGVECVYSSLHPPVNPLSPLVPISFLVGDINRFVARAGQRIRGRIDAHTLWRVLETCQTPDSPHPTINTVKHTQNGGFRQTIMISSNKSSRVSLKLVRSNTSTPHDIQNFFQAKPLSKPTITKPSRPLPSPAPSSPTSLLYRATESTFP